MSFVPSTSDNRRVIIVDFQHLAYTYAFGGASALSSTLMINGAPKIVDTTIPAYTIKQLHRWADRGRNPLVVCFDGQGSTRSKKYYFATKNGVNNDGTVVGYKEDRSSQSDKFYEGINLTQNFLLQGGVCCLRAENYEADDLIKAAVDRAKEIYPNLPIDVFTGDQDLVPLVDDQVSVYLRSRKMTWAVTKELERAHYVQLTPENYQEYMETLTDFKSLQVPYNTVLLKKLLRGKKADNIPKLPKMTPTRYNKIIDSLFEEGYNLADLCRYDAPVATICYRGTEEPIPEDIVDTVPREKKMIKFSDPIVLNNLLEALSPHLTEDELTHVHDTYIGVNLNGAFTELGDYNRRPAVIKADIKGYDMVQLQKVVSVLKINLPL